MPTIYPWGHPEVTTDSIPNCRHLCQRLQLHHAICKLWLGHEAASTQPGQHRKVRTCWKNDENCTRLQQKITGVVHVSMSQSEDSNAFHGSVFGPGVTARLGDGTGPTSHKSWECWSSWNASRQKKVQALGAWRVFFDAAMIAMCKIFTAWISLVFLVQPGTSSMSIILQGIILHVSILHK